jgi:hypothetical protein
MMIRFQIPVARSSKKRGYDGGSKTLFRVTKNLTTPCIRVNISYRIWMFGMLAKGRKGRAGKKEFGSVVARKALTNGWYGHWGRAAILA